MIEDLETLPQEDTLDLLDTIIQVAEEENYNWSSSPEEVINWLEDVRTGNNLYAIVLMWDEFTEYFKNNQNNITGLQEIAHASSRICFYFFLIRNGAANHIPGNINISVAGCEGETLLHRLDLRGICISTGAACDSVNTQISHVIKAIKVPKKYAKGTIRISLGKQNTAQEVEIIAEELAKIVKGVGM